MLKAVMRKTLRDFPLDLSITVKPGEILVLVGENGAGKSTTLNMIAGLLVPDSGSLHLDDECIFDSVGRIDIPPENRKIGYVFQDAAVFPHLTVRDNIAFGLLAHHVKRNIAAERVGHWLAALDIQDLAGVKAGGLSGGQKQRVALARALATGPVLLMLDEPFTGLDAESTRNVKALLKKQVSDMQIPCIVVTHRFADAQEMGDRVCVLSRGRKVWEGTANTMPENMPACHCKCE